MTEHTELKTTIQEAIDSHRNTNSIQLITHFQDKFYVSTMLSLSQETLHNNFPVNVVGIVGYGKVFVEVKNIVI